MSDIKQVRTAQLGDKLFIMNGVDPLRYVDLSKNKVLVYKKPRRFKFIYRFNP